MKKFNLQEYLANTSRKVVTKNGRSVRIICTDAKGKYPVVALVLDEDNDYEDIEFYTPYGECSDISECNINLFFAPVKREGYVNVYRSITQAHRFTGSIYDTKEKADEIAKCNPRYVTTTKITWEE